MSLSNEIYHIRQNPFAEFSSVFVAHLLRNVGRTIDNAGNAIAPLPIHTARDCEHGNTYHTFAVALCQRVEFHHFFIDEVEIREGNRHYFITHIRNNTTPSAILSTIRTNPYSGLGYVVDHAIRNEEVVVRWRRVGLPHVPLLRGASARDIHQSWEDYYAMEYSYQVAVPEKEGRKLAAEDQDVAPPSPTGPTGSSVTDDLAHLGFGFN